jgi:hypothetical protein
MFQSVELQLFARQWNLRKALPSVVVAGSMREGFAKECSDIHEIALIRDRI